MPNWDLLRRGKARKPGSHAPVIRCWALGVGLATLVAFKLFTSPYFPSSTLLLGWLLRLGNLCAVYFCFIAGFIGLVLLLGRLTKKHSLPSLARLPTKVK